MQFFSLSIYYSGDLSLVLISYLFAEQYLFKNFAPVLEQWSNAYAKAS